MDNAPIKSEARKVPTVARIAGDTIVELVYDQTARSTALAVSRFGGLGNIEQEVRIETGEVLVPYSARNNLIAHGCVLLPSKPEHHGDATELVADIEGFLHRYVDLSPAFERIAARYVLLSWVHDAFSEIPYLRLQGDYGTGKTRALLAIGSLCYRPFFASGASTISPVFHTLDRFGGTLVLDEADFRFSDAASEIVKILNNGNAKGFPVLRTMQDRHKEFDPRAFHVFGPKIIAMRGRYDDPALESRFLTEEMGQRSLRDDIPLMTPPSLHEEALALRNRLLHYRFCHLFETKPDLTMRLADVEPRVNQIALPLLTLTTEPELRDAIASRLEAQYRDRLKARRDSDEGRIAILLDAAFAATDGHVPVGTIAGRFNAVHGAEIARPVSGKWIGHVLREKLHLETRKSNGVYVIPRSEIPNVEALVARYTGNRLN